MKHIFAFIILISFTWFGLCPVANAASTARPVYGIDMIYGDGLDLFWHGKPILEKNRKRIPDILKNAESHGIDASVYRLEEIRRWVDKRSLTPDQAKMLDYALTYALWRYASDLAGMPLGKNEFMTLAKANNLKREVENLAPHIRLYHVLKDRLQQIRIMESRQQGDEAKDVLLEFNDKTMRQGDIHPNIPLLRARLVDYGTAKGFGDNPYLYDVNLSEAVKLFQIRHGLKDDGIIGPETLRYLNRTLADEKRQVIVNLARLRAPEWRNRPPLRIDVDIARYWLKAYEDSRLIFEMPVVVGTPKRKTEVFSTVMTGVRLNPGWTVPPTIKTEDYIPTLRENPALLAEKGVMIYADWSPDSEPIDPTTIDWTLLTDNEIKAMRMYKSAGAHNPLGLYRFLMHNRYDIYLHDTNEKNLFSKSMRARSSGCVRVADPRRIAEFLLEDDKGWTPEKIDSYLERGKTFDLGATRHIPVFFDYKTVWLDEQGRLVLGADVYNFDIPAHHDIMKEANKTKDIITNYFDSMETSAMRASVPDNSQENFPISLF